MKQAMIKIEKIMYIFKKANIESYLTIKCISEATNLSTHDVSDIVHIAENREILIRKNNSWRLRKSIWHLKTVEINTIDRDKLIFSSFNMNVTIHRTILIDFLCELKKREISEMYYFIIFEVWLNQRETMKIFKKYKRKKHEFTWIQKYYYTDYVNGYGFSYEIKDEKK